MSGKETAGGVTADASGRDATALAGGLRRELRDELSGAPLEVTAAGAEGEIAVVGVPPRTLPRLMAPDIRLRVLESVREAGFRYGAFDLTIPASDH